MCILCDGSYNCHVCCLAQNFVVIGAQNILMEKKLLVIALHNIVEVFKISVCYIRVFR